MFIHIVRLLMHTQHKVASETLKSEWPLGLFVHADSTVHCACSYSVISHVGLKESAVMAHADSLLLAEVEDEVRRQVGVVYSQDCH